MPEFKEWFVPAASGAAALLGIVNAYLNNQATQNIAALNSRIVLSGEERKFASDIMQRYDSVLIDEKSDRSTRISRLAGLLALAKLMNASEPGSLDAKGILDVIQTQADTYKGDIAELSKTATAAQADQLQAQYARVDSIGNSATAALDKIAKAEAPPPSIIAQVTGTAAPAAPAASPLDKTRIDIFWCAGTDQSNDALATASALLGKRPASSLQPWRVRALPAERNADPGYQVKGQIVRFDPGEDRIAAQIAGLAGGGFRLQQLSGTPTPGYVSVFVCPA